MKIVHMDVKDLHPYDGNPRKITDTAMSGLKRSIERFGLVQPIVWNERTKRVVGGHQRLKVITDSGEKETDVVVVDLPESDEMALNITLNNPHVAGEFSEGLRAHLVDLKASLGQDFGKLLLDELQDELHGDKKKSRDDIPETEEVPASESGKIYALGKHRVICASSMEEASFERLLEGKVAKMSVTSPPYGVGKDYEKQGIEPWMTLMKAVIPNVCKYSEVAVWQLGDLHITGTQRVEPTTVYSANMFLESGFMTIWTRIWKKPGINFGNMPYHLVSNKPAQQYEYIMAFAKDHGLEAVNETELIKMSDYALVMAFANEVKYKYVGRLNKLERREWGYAGVWEMDTVVANDKHPAMFPVELPYRCIKMHSDPGDIVLEPFCGSGTTMIACEETGRVGRGIEWMPKYVDVERKRWAEFVHGAGCDWQKLTPEVK